MPGSTRIVQRIEPVILLAPSLPLGNHALPSIGGIYRSEIFGMVQVKLDLVIREAFIGFPYL